jgi:predicted dithiol-disulfide oxidoreductase (DUF899 family)
MDRTIVYECALCAAATTMIVTDLEDPSTLVSARSKAALRDIADAKRKLGWTSAQKTIRLETPYR